MFQSCPVCRAKARSIFLLFLFFPVSSLNMSLARAALEVNSQALWPDCSGLGESPQAESHGTLLSSMMPRACTGYVSRRRPGQGPHTVTYYTPSSSNCSKCKVFLNKLFNMSSFFWIFHIFNFGFSLSFWIRQK